MREIKFRGKTENDGEWIFGDLEHYSDAIKIKHDNNPFCKGLGGYVAISSKVVPLTVGQYTGLKDKNGVKIFEGDIVLFNKNHYEIVYHDCSFSLYKAGDVPQNILSKLYMDKFTVIGNIHDKPESLKEADNA